MGLPKGSVSTSGGTAHQIQKLHYKCGAGVCLSSCSLPAASTLAAAECILHCPSPAELGRNLTPTWLLQIFVQLDEHLRELVEAHALSQVAGLAVQGCPCVFLPRMF